MPELARWHRGMAPKGAIATFSNVLIPRYRSIDHRVRALSIRCRFS